MQEYKRRLPHFHPDQAHIFLTWRLWGSLPRRHSDMIYPTPGHAFVAEDRALDRRTSAPLWLKEPSIARLITETLQAGETERHFFELHAWVVMPNHVHVLLLPQVELPVITRWVKGSTARAANLILQRTGQPFWQDESYDHWVRNEQEFIRIANYIEDNPVTAGFVQSPELWAWSSATWQAEAPAPPTPASPPH